MYDQIRLMFIFFTFLPLSGQNTVIDSKNEMTYTMWKDVPVPFFMSVYFFNVLNPKEILAGEKPMVEQRGPYVYRYSQGGPLSKAHPEPQQTLNHLCCITMLLCDPFGKMHHKGALSANSLSTKKKRSQHQEQFPFRKTLDRP